MAITAPATIVAVPDQAVAIGEPVTAEIAQDLAQAVNHLYEKLRDVAVPGATSQTVPGHQHTGAGDGHSIPRIVFSHVFGAPLGDEPAANSPTVYDFGEGGEGTSNWVSAAGMANAHNTAGWVQSVTGTAVYTTRPNLVAACPFRLRAGCKGVKVLLWRGLRWGSATNYANELTWIVELRPIVVTSTVAQEGQTASATILDNAWYDTAEADGDENAQFVFLPGVQPDGTTENGKQSMGTYLACHETAGNRLETDTDVILYVGFTPNKNAATGDTALFLYSVTVYEVMAE